MRSTYICYLLMIRIFGQKLLCATRNQMNHQFLKKIQFRNNIIIVAQYNGPFRWINCQFVKIKDNAPALLSKPD